MNQGIHQDFQSIKESTNHPASIFSDLAMTLLSKLFTFLLHEIMVMGRLQISFLSTRYMLSNELRLAVLLVDSSRCLQ